MDAGVAVVVGVVVVGVPICEGKAVREGTGEGGTEGESVGRVPEEEGPMLNE